MSKLADLVERDTALLADMDANAIGRSPMEPRMMDVPNAVANLRAAAGWANQLEGRAIPTGGYMGNRTLSYTIREPIGVVGAILPWNSPLMITTWKLAALLAAGCTVVVKPSEETPQSALHLALLAQEAGFPDGVVNVVQATARSSAARFASIPTWRRSASLEVLKQDPLLYPHLALAVTGFRCMPPDAFRPVPQ